LRYKPSFQMLKLLKVTKHSFERAVLCTSMNFDSGTTLGFPDIKANVTKMTNRQMDI